jgi:sirohydrochlorin ferrochelatase
LTSAHAGRADQAGRTNPDSPVLIATAHGTRSAVGSATVAALVEEVRRARAGLDVRIAFVDVAEPFLADVVTSVDGPLIVVPVLLSRGYHVRVDIPQALAGRALATATLALGPDPAVSRALAERLAAARAAGVRAGEQIVLVATGSSDPDAAEDLAVAAADLAALMHTPVHAAVMSGPGVPFAEAVASHGAGTVDVVPYLLAEGVFYDRLRTESQALGVATVGDPIGAHPALVELILARYDRAVAKAGEPSSDGR